MTSTVISTLLMLLPQDQETRDPLTEARDPTQIVLFVPATPAAAAPTAVGTSDETRSELAEQLVARAITEGKAGREGDAYRTLFEALALSPEHPVASAVLAPTVRELTQRPEAEVTEMTRAERAFGWRPGSWRRFQTAHFTIQGTSDAESMREFGERLERLYAAWDLLFFDVWSPPGRLVEALSEGKPLVRRERRPHTVILFASQEEYVTQLQGVAPNIESSKGYYAPTRRQSMFFVGPGSDAASYKHEVTHQLFQERMEAKGSVGDKANFWLVEGIAAAMESLEDRGEWITFGGAHSERLQYARFQLFTSQFLRPFDELAGLGQESFQSDPQVRRLYSQSAGIATWIMVDPSGDLRRGAMTLLRQTYQGKQDPQAMTRDLGIEWDEAVKAYVEFLRPRKANFDRFPPGTETTALALAYGDVDDESLASLEGMPKLEWLDLTRGPFSDGALEFAAKCSSLEQLFLGGTGVSDAGLRTLSGLTNLKELDLSDTRITNKGIEQLIRFPALETLHLSNVTLDASALGVLARIETLREVDLSGTKIDPARITEFEKQLQSKPRR